MVNQAVVFDIGAHNGQSIEKLYKVFCGKYKRIIIYSFEPMPENYNLLVSSAKDLMNKYNDLSVYTFRFAFDKESRLAKFYCYGMHTLETNQYSSLLPFKEKAEWLRLVPNQPAANLDLTAEILVSCHTGDNFTKVLNVDRINYLKIDTQGNDLNVLKGFSDFLKEQKVDFLEVECQQIELYEGGAKYEDINKYLGMFGYTEQKIDFQADGHEYVVYYGLKKATNLRNNLFNDVVKKIDVVLPPGFHSWNVSEGWINSLKESGLLGNIFKVSEENHFGLIKYLEQPDSDLILLLGFDHHLKFLHYSDELKKIWKKADIIKVLVAQETVVQNCYPDNEKLTASAIQCVDLIIYNSAGDKHFFDKFSVPSLWQPFGVDAGIFNSNINFNNRINKAYFRGKTKPIGMPGTYLRRRELLRQLLDNNLIEYKEFEYKDNLKSIVDEFNSYKIAVNLPAVFEGFTTRTFEAMACGCLLITPRPKNIAEENLFKNGEHLIYYNPDSDTDVIEKIKWTQSNEVIAARIAENGRKEVLQKHTLRNRLKNILNEIENNKPGNFQITVTNTENKDILPVHFFTIVLNGMPFIEYHINILKNLPFNWHWHIIEGVADFKNDTAWSLKNGAYISGSIHRKGLSNDGTTEYINELKKQFPLNITIYRKENGAFWNGKLEMVNIPLTKINEECILWQIDVDEFWTAENIIKNRELYISNPGKTSAFYTCNFFVGKNLVITSLDTYGNNTNYEWIRSWRFKPGDKWLAHEPPQLCRLLNNEWKDLTEINPFRHYETQFYGLQFQHFAYVIEKQLKFKETYYGYRNAVIQWEKLQKINNFPVKLKDYFEWVNDEAVVNTAESLRISQILFGAPAFKKNKIEGQKNIVFIRTDSIGDSVLASSMLKEIHNYYSDYKIAVVCREVTAEIYEASPYVNNIIKINPKRIVSDKEYLKNILEQISSLNAEYVFNSIYSRDMISDLLSINIKASKKYAHKGDLSNIDAKNKEQNDKCYTKLFESNHGSLNELKHHSDFLAGIGIQHNSLSPSIWLMKDDEEFANKIFKSNGLKKENTLALFCGAGNKIRLYENYGKAVNKFCVENNFNVVVLGNKSDGLINSENIRDITVRFINLTGKTTVRQSAAILKNCALAAGAETGLAHIACAVGTPNVILLGGGHFGRFMPYSGLTSIVSLPLECFGCNWKCKYGSINCIKDIDYNLIYHALKDKLKEKTSRIKIYLQQEYDYDYIQGMPKITDPGKFLNAADYQFVTYPKTKIEDENNYIDRILNYYTELNLSSESRSILTALCKLYLNNKSDFQNIEVLERRMVKAVPAEAVEKLYDKFSQSGFINYISGLLANNKDDKKAASKYFNKSLKSFYCKRVMYLNALAFDELNNLLFALWSYLDLLKQDVKRDEILNRIEPIKKIAAIRFGNIITLIPAGKIIPPKTIYFSTIKENIDVSIVIPSKNRTNGLKAFLQSLKYSCYRINYEILFYTGDELSEDYKQLIEEYKINKVFPDSEIFKNGEKFSWIKLMRHGFSHASGKWIMYASDDIILHPLAFNFALSLDTDNSIGGISFMHRNTVQDYGGYFKDYGYDVLADRTFINFGIIRKDAYEKTSGFDTKFKFYSGDTDICWQLIEKDYQIIPSYYSLAEHVNVEDELKISYSDEIYNSDSIALIKKWLKYLSNIKGQVLKNRFYLEDIRAVKEYIYTKSIEENIPAEYIVSIDDEYKNFLTETNSIKNDILVSAIVSAYNSEDFIKGCLDDLLNQTLYKKNKLEIVVVDSGSEQDEYSIVKSYLKKYSNIKYLKTADRETIYKAWNRGIKTASGKYITNANTDDRHKDYALEKLAGFLENNKEYDVVYADSYKTETANDNINSISNKAEIHWMDFDQDLLLFGCYIGPHPMWRKSLHQKFGYFDESLEVVGDYEFWLRISKHTKFYHLKETLGLYFYNPLSAEHKDNQTTNYEDIKVRIEYLIKNVSSIEDVERIKNKLYVIGHVENFKQYYSIASGFLLKREKGIKIEDEINNCLNLLNEKLPGENLNFIKNEITQIETTDAIFNKEYYLEQLYSTQVYILQKNKSEKEMNNQELNSEKNNQGFNEGNMDYKNHSKLNPENMLAEAYLLFERKSFRESLYRMIDAERLFNGQLSGEKNIEFAGSFYNMKGFNYLGLNEADNARRCFEKALEINPVSSQACAGLGEIFLIEGEHEKAKTMYEWALVNGPQNGFAASGLANVNSLLGFEPEHNSLNKDVNSENATEKNLNEVLTEILSKVYEIYNENKFDSALKFLNDNEQLFYSRYKEDEENKLISAYENLKGFILLSLNDNENAKLSFESALKLNPSSSQACSGLGEIFYLNGDDENAKTMYEWGVKNDPDNIFAKAGLAKINILLGLEPDNNSLEKDEGNEINSVLISVLNSVRELDNLQHYEEAYNTLIKTEHIFNSYNNRYNSEKLQTSYNKLKDNLLVKMKVH